jgi:hypothetical protein
VAGIPDEEDPDDPNFVAMEEKRVSCEAAEIDGYYGSLVHILQTFLVWSPVHNELIARVDRASANNIRQWNEFGDD